jgi:hypothetical protein
MSLVTALAATLSLAAAPAPQAATAQETADLQCLAISMVFGGMSDDESVKTGLMAASMFYLGRLEGRNPGVVWLDSLTDYLKTATPDQLQAQSERCGTEIAAFGSRIQTWSTRMAAEAPARPAS